MEDWEEFFEEKSRRRADKELRKSRTRKLKTAMIMALAAAAAVGAVYFYN